MEVTDVMPKGEGQVPVYYIHGLRQYYGTCKMHKRLDCHHLVKWKPGRRGANRIRMAKVVMRDWYDNYGSIPMYMKCRACFWK